MRQASSQTRWWLAGAFAGIGFGLVDGLLVYAPGGGPGDDVENLLGVAASVAVWSIAGALALALAARSIGAERGENERFAALSTRQWVGLVVAAALGAVAAACIGLHLTASLLGVRATSAVRAGITLLASATLGLIGGRLLRSEAARRPGRLALALGGASLLALSGLFVHDVATPAPAAGAAAEPAPPPSGPNVVLIVLDTTRADHMSAYGYRRPTTPFLEELAGESTLYENAVSPAPWTLPSHASLFTGQFPSVHGANAEHQWLRDKFLTLAEILRRHGYVTAGFSNNPTVSHSSNLDQGFQSFTNVFLEWGPELGWDGGVTGVQRTIPERLFHKFLVWHQPPDKGGRRTDHLIGHWLDAWQAAPERRPFFLFVNLLEAHLPYEPPPRLRDRFVTGPPRPAIAALRTPDWFHEAFRLMANPGALVPEDYAQIGDYYDAELAYQDERLRDLVGALRHRGLLDDTLLIVTADHGENLGEHGGLLNHVLSFHETLLHVPLVVRRPGRFPAGLRYQAPVSTVGIFATVLDALGIAPPPDQPPAVGPLPRTATEPGPTAVVAEYELPVFELAAMAQDTPGYDIGPLAVRQRAAIQGSWKLVRKTPGGNVLYDLARDPGEASPLAADSAPEGIALSGWLDRWEAGIPADAARVSTSHALDAQTRQALHALGYVR